MALWKANLGDIQVLGVGPYEFRIDFGEDGPRIVVLLAGGDKASQERDIKKAKMYWEDYNA